MGNFSFINKAQFFDDLFDNSYIAILVVDKNRTNILANNRFCEMFGFEENEILGQNISILHKNEESYNNFEKQAFNFLVENKSVSIDYEFKRKDSSYFWAKISSDPFKNKEYTLWTLIDITENVKMKNDLESSREKKEEREFQKKLEEQKRLLQTVIDEIPYPVILKNYEGKFILVNRFLAKLYNTTPSDMIGKDDGDYISNQEMVEHFRRNVKEIMNKGETEVVYEDSLDVNTNETRNFMSIKKPFENEHGDKFILILATDITELNKKNKDLNEKERILFRQSKLASMGEMLANIAHQWRQPLSAISTMATGMILEKELNILSDEKIKNGLTNINENTQFLSQTIEDFRGFYNPKDNDKKEISVSSVINKVLNIIKGQFYSNSIKVVKEIDDCTIKALENELIQVILNLLNNARDALCQINDDKIVLIKTEVKKDSLFIDIIDSAGGIDKKIIDKIFEPYFTTKHKSIGTGIGLYMSEEIVVKHLGGKIEASNSSFKIEDKSHFGAKFRIKLPLNLELKSE